LVATLVFDVVVLRCCCCCGGGGDGGGGGGVALAEELRRAKIEIVRTRCSQSLAVRAVRQYLAPLYMHEYNVCLYG
jgi:hypothetical protein